MTQKRITNGIFKNISLKPYTTYKIGGAAEYFAKADSIEGLKSFLKFDPNAFILGRGSNLLVSDKGVNGLVIAVCMKRVEVSGAELIADGGASLALVSKTAYSCGLAGFEWACAIPGSVGGAVKMNAGAFGGCMADILTFADVLRGGEIMRREAKELCFSYRHSGIKKGDVVVRAGFKLTPSDKNAIAALRKLNNERRSATQPSGYSAGSVFKAADKAAGWYIDKAGLKGLTSGGATVSDKHANFILNTGSATASDVASLINAVKAEVYVRFNVMLEEEIEYVGEF